MWFFCFFVFVLVCEYGDREYICWSLPPMWCHSMTWMLTILTEHWSERQLMMVRMVVRQSDVLSTTPTIGIVSAMCGTHHQGRTSNFLIVGDAEYTHCLLWYRMIGRMIRHSLTNQLIPYGKFGYFLIFFSLKGNFVWYSEEISFINTYSWPNVVSTIYEDK